ncbi:MAG: metal transporter [Chloroflexi bacterium]|nr:metal transporter [Chloroflexota bacterium]
MNTTQPPRFSIRTFGLLLLPVILLGGVIALFLRTGGGLDLESPVPIETLTIERTILKEDLIEIRVQNTSMQEITLAQAIVNSAVWPIEVTPSATIPRLGRAVVRINYPWSYGEAYAVTLFTSNAVAFNLEIPVAFETPQPNSASFWSFALIGLYVGVIPVFLGIFWFPALRTLGRRWIVFLMAVTAGLLIFLGLDTIVEAFEQAANVPGSFQGIGIIGIGAIATFLALEAISKRQLESGGDEAAKRLSVAFRIAIGIGIHNLGEGLAIGAAYNIGEISFGTFLVIGFIIQNITEGLGIIAPVLRDRPSLRSLALMGIVGGAPAILGAWIGGFAPSPTLAVLFLAIGTGAIFQVVFEIAKLIQKDTAKESMPAIIFSGALAGMALLWVTGLLIK